MIQLSDETERMASAIVDSAIKVHQELGPGLLEHIYEICFCYELNQHGLSVERQKALPIIYKGIRFDAGLQLDVLVENTIICELKAVEIFHKVWEA